MPKGKHLNHCRGSSHPKFKHGLSGHHRTPEYMVWLNMRDRCNNPDAKDYRYYGGRGIRVCRRWGSYEEFLADMGERPGPDFTIDRRRRDGNYCPSNCRWATRKQQSRNRDYNKMTMARAERVRRAYDKGAKQAALASRFGVTQSLISKIVRRQLWV